MGVTTDLQRTWTGEESSANDFLKFCYFEIIEFYLLCFVTDIHWEG